MVRQAHHPEPSRRVNHNNQNSKFDSVAFDSFDLEALDRFAQDREPVEPFVIWCLLFEI
jgi:hypothetical protein